MDMIGKTFGKLTVIGRSSNNSHRAAMWECKCSCGKSKIIKGASLRSGWTRSCGCLQAEATKSHGMSQSIIYHKWTLIKDRCQNPNNNDYSRYGGRGITLCDRWNKFENFFDDMGYPQDETSTIDRINNNKGYGPLNCRWIDQKTNSRNTRQSKWWFIHGHRFTSSTVAAKFYGVTHHTILAWCGLKKHTKTKSLPLCYAVKKYDNA